MGWMGWQRRRRRSAFEEDRQSGSCQGAAKSLGIVMARSRIDAAVIICQLLVSHLQIIKRKRVETYRCSDADASNGMSLALS
jgi:hypothetical protein